MPMLRVIAGPDGIDPYVRDMPIGDPADVDRRHEGPAQRGHVLVKVSRELRAARDCAPPRRSRPPARRSSTTSLKSMKRALELYLAVLKLEAGVSVATSSSPRAAARRTVRGGLHAQGPAHARAALLLMSEWMTGKMPQGRMTRHARRARGVRARGRRRDRRRRAAAPDAPARRAEARPDDRQAWLLTTTAVFNLAGVPVAQIPLGLNDRGLPLGVQAAAGRATTTSRSPSRSSSSARSAAGCPRPDRRLLRPARLRPLLRQPLRPPHGASAIASAGSTRRRGGWSASSSRQGIAGATVLEIGGGVGEIHLELLRRAPSTPSTSSSRPPTTPRRRGSRARPVSRSASSGGCTTSPSIPRRSRPPTSSSCTASCAATPTTSACWAPRRRTRGGSLVFSTRGQRRLASSSWPREPRLRLTRREFRGFVHPRAAMIAVLGEHGLSASFAEGGFAWEARGATR